MSHHIPANFTLISKIVYILRSKCHQVKITNNGVYLWGKSRVNSKFNNFGDKIRGRNKHDFSILQSKQKKQHFAKWNFSNHKHVSRMGTEARRCLYILIQRGDQNGKTSILRTRVNYKGWISSRLIQRKNLLSLWKLCTILLAQIFPTVMNKNKKGPEYTRPRAL